MPENITRVDWIKLAENYIHQLNVDNEYGKPHTKEEVERELNRIIGLQELIKE